MTALAALALSPAGAVSLARLAYPVTDNEIIGQALDMRPAVIALDAPLSLPGPVTAALAGGVWEGHPSPYTRAAERDPIWRALGVRPLPVSFLGGLTFRALPLVAQIRALAPASTVIEVFPTASMRALGVSHAGERRLAKTSLAGRQTAHTALNALVSGLPDALDAGGPLDADALDAIAAALTAAAYAKGVTLAAGDPAEGCIILIDAARAAALHA